MSQQSQAARSALAAKATIQLPDLEALQATPSADLDWMQRALAEAELAGQQGEVPVGAVLVMNNKLVAQAGNACIRQSDPTAHAEVLAIRRAAAEMGNYRLSGAVLYCTLEPCAMCIGAIMHARVAKLVFAAREPKTGACGSAFDLASDPAHGHRLQIEQGILRDASAKLLSDFFQRRRQSESSKNLS